MKKRLVYALAMMIMAAGLSLLAYSSKAAGETPEEYVDLGFGFFPHFGINTFTGTDGGDGNPHNYPSSMFAPTDFDADQWVTAAKDAGMQYVIVVAKHRYGWAAWDSAYTTYDIATSSTPNLDIVKAVSDACALHGLKFAIYFNSDDRYHFPNGVTGDSDYTQFAENELSELLTNYGDVMAIWFDHASVLTDNQASELESYVKSIQPNTLTFFHDEDKDDTSDVIVHEIVGGDPPQGNANPWEECWRAYNDYWAFSDTEGPVSPWNSATYVANKLHYYNKRYAAFALDIPPGPSGKISPAGLQLMHDIGQIVRWKQTDDRSSSITYGGGTWNDNTNTDFYKSTGRNSSDANAYAQYTFTGTGIRLVTKKSPTAGKFDIYVDGTKVSTFDSYAASPAYDVTAYETTSLSDTTHTIKMVVTGTKNANSTGYNCNLDLFEYSVNPPGQQEDTVVDDTNSALAYSGAWSHIARATSYEGTISYSSALDSSVEYTFSGTGVKLYTQKGPGGGKFDVYIDGVDMATYDSYASAQQNKVLAYDKQDLTAGTHTIKLVVDHAKNSNSNNYNCHLDYISYH